MYKAAVKALTPRYCFILLAMYMRYTLNFVLRLVFFLPYSNFPSTSLIEQITIHQPKTCSAGLSRRQRAVTSTACWGGCRTTCCDSSSR